jgi:hypothetical protein
LLFFLRLSEGNMNKEQNAALEAERVAAESWYEEYAAKGWSVSKIATTTAFKAGIEYARAQLAAPDNAALLREVECLKSAVLVSQRSAVAISKELRAQLAAPAGVADGWRDLLELLVIDDERRIKHAGSWRQELHKRATELLYAPSPAPMAAPSNDQLMKLAGECLEMPGGCGMLYANYAREVLRRWGSVTAPASEQKPVWWQFFQDGEWHMGFKHPENHCANTEAAGYPVRDLYAGPVMNAPSSDVVQVPRELQDEAEHCAFVLENIGSMDAEDIDGDAIDLRLEDADGRDTGCDVSIVEYAERAANVIRALLNGGRV